MKNRCLLIEAATGLDPFVRIAFWLYTLEETVTTGPRSEFHVDLRLVLNEAFH